MSDFILIFISVFLGILAGTFLTVENYEARAAETSCAQYHPVTGEFEWLED